MLVADHEVGVAVTPLNVTVLAPRVEPKPVPVMVTDVPTTPLAGATELIEAVGTTVKATPLLTAVPRVTVTLPVVASPGTGTVMLVSLQAVGVAIAPLNATVLVRCVGPKFVP